MEELLLEEGKTKLCFKRGFIQLNVPLVKKNILQTPRELKLNFQKGEKDMVFGMKMSLCGMDRRLGIADKRTMFEDLGKWVPRLKGGETVDRGRESQQSLSGQGTTSDAHKHM